MNDSPTSAYRRALSAEEPRAWLDVPSIGDGDDTVASAKRLGVLAANLPGKLVVDRDISPAALEQYRRVAAVLHQAQENRAVKTVMITSAFASEGKSLTAANLALTLSESYRRRVLLIDADLRRPTLHDTFQIPNLAGVSDWLRSPGTAKMPFVRITSHLTLVPGGRPDADPMGGLASERMKQMLAVAGSRFDWIVLDTPPVALLSDGHLLASAVDTVVLVVAAGRTPASVVQRAVTDLGRERIIGVVLNRVANGSLRAYGPESYYERYRNPTGKAAESQD
jgi:capsular exopolysaccharide synthesis family protein